MGESGQAHLIDNCRRRGWFFRLFHKIQKEDGTPLGESNQGHLIIAGVVGPYGGIQPGAFNYCLRRLQI